MPLFGWIRGLIVGEYSEPEYPGFLSNADLDEQIAMSSD